MRKLILSGVFLLILSLTGMTQDKKPSPLTAEQNKQIVNIQRTIREAEARKRAADAEYNTALVTYEAVVRQFFIDNKVNGDAFALTLLPVGNTQDVFGFAPKAETPKPEAKSEAKK